MLFITFDKDAKVYIENGEMKEVLCHYSLKWLFELEDGESEEDFKIKTQPLNLKL